MARVQPEQALLGLPGIMAGPRGPRRDKSLLDEAARIEGALRPTKVRRKMTVDGLVHKKLMGNFKDYDKITIDEGSMTVQQLFDWLDKKFAIEVYLLACGDYSLYNGFLPGNKHKARLDKKIEDIFHEIDGGELPAHKKYLIIVPGGTIKESGDDFQIAPLKYVFRK